MFLRYLPCENNDNEIWSLKGMFRENHTLHFFILRKLDLVGCRGRGEARAARAETQEIHGEARAHRDGAQRASRNHKKALGLQMLRLP